MSRRGAAGVSYASEIHPGTVHGFTMSDTDAFSASGLKRHWDRLLPLLDRALGDGRGSRPETAHAPPSRLPLRDT